MSRILALAQILAQAQSFECISIPSFNSDQFVSYFAEVVPLKARGPRPHCTYVRDQTRYSGDCATGERSESVARRLKSAVKPLLNSKTRLARERLGLASAG
jgi:hypothetical protein